MFGPPMVPRPTHWLARELAALARLAVPMALASAAQSLMGIVDAAVVGRAGAVPLGAIGLSNALFFALAVLGTGLMMGLDPMVSQAFGAGERQRARRLLWQGVWLSLAAGVAIALPAALLPFALEPLGIGQDVAITARRCLWVRIPSLPFLLLFFAGRSYLMAAGRTRPILVATISANFVNLALDLLFVFGGRGLPAWSGPLRLVPAMGAPGSALSTALCTVLQAAVLAFSVRAVPLEAPPSRRPARADIAAAIRVGLPVGLHMAAEVGVFTLVGFLAGRLGAVPLAAHQIAITYASFSFTAAVGIGNAGSVRVGWAVGARDTLQARRSGLTAFAAGASIMAAWGLAFFLLPSALVRVMTNQPEVVAAAAPLMMVAAVFQISDGIQGVGAGVLRGAADTRFTFAANTIGHYGVGLPIAVTLGIFAGLGVTGLWWGLCAGLTVVAAGLFVRFLRISSREIVPLETSGTTRVEGPA
jgi:MATE family multidrug resistance protein